MNQSNQHSQELSISLDRLAKNAKATILRFIGDSDFAKRMREMGLNTGTSVELTGIAPFGDPVTIKIGRTTLALRLKDAEKIMVKEIL